MIYEELKPASAENIVALSNKMLTRWARTTSRRNHAIPRNGAIRIRTTSPNGYRPGDQAFFEYSAKLSGLSDWPITATFNWAANTVATDAYDKPPNDRRLIRDDQTGLTRTRWPRLADRRKPCLCK